ncbi:hypothetical protein [Enterobacter cloacae]
MISAGMQTSYMKDIQRQKMTCCLRR